MAGKRNQSELGRALISQLRWALKAPDITARDKVVLLALSLRADRYNLNCWPSLSTLSGDTGLSIKSLSNSIQNLKRSGLIRVMKRNRNNLYFLQQPDD